MVVILAIMEGMELDDDECITDVQDSGAPGLDLGEEVRLLQDATAYRAAFGRFEHDEENCWSAEKAAALGAIGVVIEVYPDDFSVALELVGTGGRQLHCPMEAIEAKTGGFDVRFEWARAKYQRGQRVRLVPDPQAFRESFYRFEGDQTGNGWSPEKQQYAGAEGAVAAVFDDKTLTLEFSTGVQLDFPYEAIELPTDVTWTPM